MYADDTVVNVSGKTHDSVSDRLNINLDKVLTWLESSCLTLNIKKTNSTWFSINKTSATKYLNVRIKGELNKYQRLSSVFFIFPAVPHDHILHHKCIDSNSLF